MATTPEGKVKAKVDRMLHRHKVWFFSPQAGPFGRAGIPDRLICVHGRFVGIEVKADRTKKPTRLQEQCMAQIEAAGGKCFVVYDDESLAIASAYIGEITRAGSTKGESPSTEAEQPS